MAPPMSCCPSLSTDWRATRPSSPCCLTQPRKQGVVLECVTENVEDSSLGKLVMSLRAFAAEVEREKIVERTTRGKLERARSGRIPPAFGRGCYGYVYNPATGQREIEPFQAEVVRRIFNRFTE